MGRPLTFGLTFLAVAGTSACSSDYPARPDGPVLDQAAVIPDVAEQALEGRLRQYFRTRCRAVVVVTLPSLNGQTIERYATDLANRWKIGDSVHGDGVLLLVAPADHQVRVEVSKSLERVLSDRAAAEVIQSGMLSNYKRGDYEGGIARGIDEITRRLDAAPQTKPACNPDRAAA